MDVQYPESFLPIVGEPISSEPDQNAIDRPLLVRLAFGAHMAIAAACMPMSARDRCLLGGRYWRLSVVDVICIRCCRVRLLAIFARSCSPWCVAAERSLRDRAIRGKLIDDRQLFGR